MKGRRKFLVVCAAVTTAILFWSTKDDYYTHPHPPPRRPPPPPPPPPPAHDVTNLNPAAPDSHDDASVAAEPFLDFSHTDRPFMPTSDPLCARLPGLNSSIVLIVKTGATEASDKLPTQLQTILRCVPDLLVFSDMEQTFAGLHVRDSLDTILDDVKKNPDFDLYRAQKECLVSQGDCTRHRDKGKEGWNMDKYKNIHIAEKAYSLRPGRDWYVVIDADTYLFWTTLVVFLEQIDPARKMFLGSIAHYKDFPFAHGGSGYIVSRGAMDAFVGQNPGIGNKYDQRVTEECCGDWMFSKAMKETSGISVTQAFPTINGDKVWSMPFGHTHWCHPLATMHHIVPEEMSFFWEFEMKRYLSTNPSPDAKPNPVLLKDMYKEYFLPRLTSQREDWNNISEDIIYLGREPTDDEKNRVVPENKQTDVEKVAHASIENCRAACEANPECYQYSYWGEGKCNLSNSFKIGYPAKHEEEVTKRQTAGWLEDRIKAWVEEQGECEEAKWPDTAPGFFSKWMP
ncbi:uncharacterized protein DNG_01486 [Cephalotrichum gorgonifer]|uniref:N-acetylgalactosaminide beta-1,3-galactosyltransferase n=1 Tax=Cephalotrichum gorgonifer TaxID=2041049 RepID=A0AAE8MT36_9PEZI|nr:uncharacterized protein DNG_01486 [Cephalotrichum gorgonifer]